MASVKGFEVKAVKGFRGKEGEALQQANLYYENKKVGFLSDDADGGVPVIQVNEDYASKWADAVAYFKEYLYDNNQVASQEELFYYLLAIKEWEQVAKKEFQKGMTKFVVLEEFEKTNGYRTGAYKLFACNTDEDVGSIGDDTGDNEVATESVRWKKTILHSVDELTFN